MSGVTAAVPSPAEVVTGQPRPGRGLQAGRRRRLTAIRVVILIVVGAYLLVPLAALVEFSTRGVGVTAPRTLSAWRAIFERSDIIDAVVVSLETAVLTSIGALLLVVPTLIWIRLRVPWLARVMEFVCLLPLTIPAIVLVVGLGPIYTWLNAWLSYFGARSLTNSVLVLGFAYVILVLPYVYRSLDTALAAIDLRTMSEAARSLGAGWPTVMVRVIVPNIASGVLSAGLLSVALVLGEFTFASLLNYENLQFVLNEVGLADPGIATAVSAASLFFVFLLLFAMSFIGGRRGRSAPAEEG
jgi:putative spermidine/putrescine transport system permease protein